MFLHGKNGRTQNTDFRPEVHDSDGLLIHNGRDEWIWHSLEAGRMLRINAFSDENPRGFGLIQRERRFDEYQDLVAHFEKRPSVWVLPRGAWGKGSVQLVQIPSDREFQDNIVAFWVPESAPKPGVPLSLEYELHWTKEDHFNRELGQVRATRIGRVVVDPPKNPANLRFVIDFGGAAVESLSNREILTAEVTYGKDVKFVADSVYKNEVDQTWRLVIEIADPGKAADLTALLKYHDRPITETWTYTWQP
jgi:glucans biosynthesis protein